MATKASQLTLDQILDLDRIRFPAANGVGAQDGVGVRDPAQDGIKDTVKDPVRDQDGVGIKDTNTNQALQAILNAIGPQPTGCRLSKKNHQRAHSPENSCWVPVTQQTRAEFRALVQELAFGKPKPRPKP